MYYYKLQINWVFLTKKKCSKAQGQLRFLPTFDSNLLSPSSESMPMTETTGSPETMVPIPMMTVTKPEESHYISKAINQELKVIIPYSLLGLKMVVVSALHTGCILPPRKIIWCSVLLEAKSTLGP
jgi:hypothetical protein